MPAPRTTFDAFDGRSSRIKTNAELEDGIKRVPEYLAQCDNDPAHQKMWRNILRELQTEVRYRRDVRNAVRHGPGSS